MTPAFTKPERECIEARFQTPLYTLDNIKYWEERVQKLNQAPYEATVTTFDGNGDAHEIAAKGPNKILRYASYHQAVHKAEAQSASDECFEYILVRVTDANTATPPAQCCDTARRREEYAEYTKNWKKSAFFIGFRKKFKDKAQLMAEVKSVACFGLGELRPDTNRPLTHVIANYLQHILARDIRDWIAWYQKTSKENIPIYAQDPKYCASCKHILTSELGFTIMESNSGFLEVNGNTFVVTSAPTVPVRQIVGDLTKAAGGPAGMLCQPIDDDGVLAADGIVDMSSPSIYQFAVGAHIRDMDAVWRTGHDDSSEEECDARNTVYYSKEYPEVEASVFPDIAIYIKKR